jgi:hypothetical protein
VKLLIFIFCLLTLRLGAAILPAERVGQWQRSMVGVEGGFRPAADISHAMSMALANSGQ